jgi:DNA-binding beta-propeller fold protein YncE
MTHYEKNDISEYNPGARKNPAKTRSAELYQAAQFHIQQGEWEAGLTAVDELLHIYPEVQELHDMRSEILQHLPSSATNPYQKNPQYRSAMRHIKNAEWAPALAIVNGLLETDPKNERLLSLQGKLQQKIANQARLGGRRRWQMLSLTLLLVAFLLVSGLFYRYLKSPAPLAELIAPNASLKYAPHYLFSIYGTDKPLGVAISTEGDRIYVSEMGGSRLVKMFDRNGNPQGSIELPHTSAGERAPVYMATDHSGRVYVSDRMQHSVFIFNKDGQYQNTMLGPETTLSEYVSDHTQGQLTGEKFSFNLFKNLVFYQSGLGAEESLELPYVPEWAPLGIRIGSNGQIYLTDVAKSQNSVLIVSPVGDLESSSSSSFDPMTSVFGTSGQGDGEFLYPNGAMPDSQGRIFVSDGNNARISVWDSQGNFLFNFGRGVGDGALSLPRGIFIDQKDRLFVVDSVGQNIKTYDVSGSEPEFLYAFGDFGMGDGMFNYPNDIAVDQSGRLYIVDRENNRIQVWTY